MLSGDDLPGLSAERFGMLKKMVPPTGVPARFSDESFSLGRMPLDGREMVAVFNWSDKLEVHTVPLAAKSRVTDYWTGVNMGVHERKYDVGSMPAHSARLFEIVPVGE